MATTNITDLFTLSAPQGSAILPIVSAGNLYKTVVTTVGGPGYDYITIATGGAIQTKGAYTGTADFTGNVAGNARGDGALDLQTFRTAAANVASGTFSCLISHNSKASGTASICYGGSGNVASGTAAACIGGRSNTASGDYSVCLGGNTNVASGTESFCGPGQGCTASATRSAAIGLDANAYLESQIAMATGQFSTAGDAQSSMLHMFKQTTNNTAASLLIDGTTAGKLAVLPNNTTWLVRGEITARRADADGENDAWLFHVAIYRDANAASTTLLAAATITQLGATAWTVAISADTTNGALDIQVTGATSKTINWSAGLLIVEAGG